MSSASDSARNTPPIGTTLLEAGWHEGVEMATYLSDPAVSASMLWKFHQEHPTPAHFIHAVREKPDDGSAAKNLGTLTHVRVYEPDVFDSRYVVIGQCEGRKNDGDRCQYQGKVYRDGQSFCGTHDPHGKDVPMDPLIEVTTETNREAAIAMDAALRSHQTAREIIEAPGPREVVGVCQDPKTGLWLRIRPDQLIEAPEGAPERYHWSVPNLKTTGRGADLDSFTKESHRLGLYFKAAFYRMVVRELWDIEPQNFLYPTVESAPPHEVIVYRLHEDAIDIGEAEVRNALNQLAECIESDTWPGYGIALHNLTLPEWRLKQVHDIDFLEVA